jgi:hypothetical protein
MIQPTSLNTILKNLGEYAAQMRTPVIVDARIAVTPQDAKVLDLRPALPLQTIRY